jgi:predicted nucleic acid-binding protein
MNDPVSLPFLYIDANPFIYLVEGSDEVAAPLEKLFARLRSRPGAAATSELTLAEVLPKAQLPDHRRAYLDMIVWSGLLDLRPVTREILIETASYRKVSATLLPDGRQVMANLPDAIHVVTAIRAGCTRLLSADIRIKVPIGMTLVKADNEGIETLLGELS